MHKNLQKLVLKGCKGDNHQDELQAVLTVYKDDLSKTELEAQLPLLKPLFNEASKELADHFSVHDVVCVLSKLFWQR